MPRRHPPRTRLRCNRCSATRRRSCATRCGGPSNGAAGRKRGTRMARDAINAQLQQRLDTLLLQQRELVDSLERGQSYFQHVARSVWRVQEEERRRLARELHDGLGQNLTAILRMLEQAA